MKKSKFETDGCSGYMSWTYAKYRSLYFTLLKKEKYNGYDLLPWHEDCVEHDLPYHGAGTKKDRLEADIQLMIRVAASWISILSNFDVLRCKNRWSTLNSYTMKMRLWISI